jgi:hypothetical protein
MRILYVIFVLCVGVLVWAAIAVATHIRRHNEKIIQTTPAEPTPELPLDDQEIQDQEILVGANKPDGK